ncbi:MAG: phage holin family protein [Verrucomicrobia bacterium]|nr:phage holin family protein [Verrucomicrobiota bacterium]
MPDPSSQPTPEGRDTSHGPSTWIEALLAIANSRAELIRLEAKDAARKGSNKAARVIAAILCVTFGWSLLLAGGIGALSKLAGWPWFWTALAIGAIHIIVAAILLRKSSGANTPLFPVTRAEFQRDREWIENLQKNPKSNA